MKKIIKRHVGLTNYLSRRKPSMGTPEFGKSFEHFIFMELKAFQAYSNPELEIHYWRTASGYEVDFILDDMNVAIEIKSSSKIHSGACQKRQIFYYFCTTSNRQNNIFSAFISTIDRYASQTFAYSFCQLTLFKKRKILSGTYRKT
jgi:predicted AAA+ superfamily ATPase